MEGLTVSEFLRSVCELVTDAGIQYVLAKRRLKGDELIPQPEDASTSSSSSSSSEEYTTLTEREMDLAEGTMYYWLASLPVGGSTEKVADGGWSHSEGGWTVSKANIEEWKSRYRALFDKWDEPLLGNSKIRIINF